MTKVTVKKYTEAHEAAIRSAAAAGPLNQAVAERLAAEFGNGHSSKGVIAKITRMGLPYERKKAVTKTGAPVEQKEAIVSQIEALVGATLDGLEKAPKPALQSLRDFLAA